MLDYGGTLVSGSEKTENVQYYAVSNKLTSRKGPGKEALATLRDLCGDLKNSVFVVTGMERQALEAGFGGVGNLGLGAEHGFFFKMPHAHHSPPAAAASAAAPPSSSSAAAGSGGWEMMLPSFDSSWMQLARAIMDVYVKRTHGTYIEQKGSALLWQYRDADPEFGHMQSKELEVRAFLRACLGLGKGGGGGDVGFSLALCLSCAHAHHSPLLPLTPNRTT